MFLNMCVSLRIGQIKAAASCGNAKGSLPLLVDAPAYIRSVLGYQRMQFLYPCGRCAECVKKRRNAIAYCIENELRNSKDNYFLTFTFSDWNLPISRREVVFDKDTGEIIEYKKAKTMNYFEVPFEIRKQLLSKPAGKYPRYVSRDIEDLSVRLVYTPSLKRSMFCRALDAYRQKFRRQYGNTRNFKYWCIGEYGPRTCRPHLHCVISGLNNEEILQLIKYWPFGHVDVKKVECLKNCKNGFVHLGRYLGKYVSKGCAECKSVSDRFAEKPRIVSSPNFGTAISEQQRNYILCFDMVGRYNPKTLQRFDGSYLTKLEVDMIAREYPKRLKYEIDNFTFMLPRSVIRRVTANFDWLRPFDNKLETMAKIPQIRSLPLFSYVSSVAVDRYLEVCNRKYQPAREKVLSSEGNVFSSFKADNSENDIQTSLSRLYRDDSLTYNKSFC